MNSTFQLAELVLQLNSLLNPILYCYSDRRFKNAVQELLGLKKTQKIQPTFHANRCLRRKESFQSVEMKLQGEEIFIVQSTKSAPSEPPVEHEGASSVNMERSISGYCSDSFAQCNVQIPEPLSVHTTTAVIHSQSSRQCGYRISKERFTLYHQLQTTQFLRKDQQIEPLQQDRIPAGLNHLNLLKILLRNVN